MPWKLRTALVAAVWLFVTPHVNADDPTIQDIAKALQEWKDSWVTLRVEWERRNPVQLRRYANDPKILNAESLDDYFRRGEWIFAGDGLDRYTTDLIEAGESVIREVEVHDAEQYFNATYKPKAGDPDFLSELRWRIWNPSKADRSDPRYVYSPLTSALPMGPLYNDQQDEWLGETLLRGDGTLEDFEEIDGIRCARVKLGEYHLWLDPRHGFLPRRLESIIGAKGLVVGTVWRVEDFQRLENGIWFPMRGTFWYKNDPADELDYWAVTDVAVNETLAPELFEPPQPGPETQVWGAPMLSREEIQRVLERAQANPPTRSRIESAVALWYRAGNVIRILIVAIGVLGAGFWLSRRK